LMHVRRRVATPEADGGAWSGARIILG
jgi:hypothetical protein